MATVDVIEDLTGLDKATQLDVLRRRMATVPGGRRDHAPANLPTIAPPDRVEPLDRVTPLVDDDGPEPLTAAVRGKTLRTMPVPPPLAALAGLLSAALAAGMEPTQVQGIGRVITPDYVADHIGAVQSYT
ncbi:hypothetical protein [Rhodococcus sp. ARC_M5]|uniref:hypothetical protein n=1 Tax=Rhodococcus sp. ARC_M5 TaxID=2928851 RepID=UPI001FB35D7B|nr:hypothetical protein [Rhodococcus sp. ARC_M5]MCJ0894677.1 hypothetical protein [Rhodococcus sp. ARC_M5]